MAARAAVLTVQEEDAARARRADAERRLQAAKREVPTCEANLRRAQEARERCVRLEAALGRAEAELAPVAGDLGTVQVPVSLGPHSTTVSVLSAVAAARQQAALGVTDEHVRRAEAELGAARAGVDRVVEKFGLTP